MGLPVLVDVLDERTKAFMSAGDRAEIHINGPFLRELSKNYYQAVVTANILLTSRFDSRKNAYDLLKYAGGFQSALDDEIPVYNFGSESGDYEDSLIHIGCLVPRFGKVMGTSQFGQVHEVDHVRQTECECSYMIELTDN
jgi:hypothetical protein